MRQIIGVAIAVILLFPLLAIVPMVAVSGPIAPAGETEKFRAVADEIGLAWQELMALAAVTNEDIGRMTREEIEDLARLFCGEDKCKTLLSLDEVMIRLDLSDAERKQAHDILTVFRLMDTLSTAGPDASIDEIATACTEGDLTTPAQSSWTWPVPGHYTITSCYGLRVDPVTGVPGTFHTGMDVGAPSGTPIVASNDGTVIDAGWRGNYGYCVLIDHGMLGQTRYGHMSKITVSPGQQVRAGQTIGYVGSTGKSTGPHLHLEWIVDGRTFDPINLFRD